MYRYSLWGAWAWGRVLVNRSGTSHESFSNGQWVGEVRYGHDGIKGLNQVTSH